MKAQQLVVSPDQVVNSGPMNHITIYLVVVQNHFFKFLWVEMIPIMCAHPLVSFFVAFPQQLTRHGTRNFRSSNILLDNHEKRLCQNTNI